jgi:hypothetical protein
MALRQGDTHFLFGVTMASEGVDLFRYVRTLYLNVQSLRCFFNVIRGLVTSDYSQAANLAIPLMLNHRGFLV